MRGSEPLKLRKILHFRHFHSAFSRSIVNDAVAVVENPLFYVGTGGNIGVISLFSPSTGVSVVVVVSAVSVTNDNRQIWHVPISAMAKVDFVPVVAKYVKDVKLRRGRDVSRPYNVVLFVIGQNLIMYQITR